MMILVNRPWHIDKCHYCYADHQAVRLSQARSNEWNLNYGILIKSCGTNNSIRK
uniref:Uncharacterized protein n=1 Tax=Lotus japonicus TaxID=34305 RepID=I3RZJ1_LOTJA|nr:unknown [Lotus japonicus]